MGNKDKTIRSLRLLLNEVYLTYGLSHQLPDVVMDKIANEINNSEPRMVMSPPLLGNDIQINPEPENNQDAHTEHCCVIHGCKYGNEDCSVVNDKKRQSMWCETCYEIEQEDRQY